MNITLTSMRLRLIRHETTALALVQQSLGAVGRHTGLNAIAHLAADDALRTAAAADAAAPAGPLHGLPVTVKDLYNIDGMPTRGGTRAALPDLGGEAIAVTRLKRAGAIVIAKTNLHEIASGISGENAWTGDVCNPIDPARQAGGSSGGSAVAVATGMGLASLGSDTAGSARVPAAFCGVVGFKPTFGLIPLDGALPLCWSCDHAGPLARSVADIHLLTEILADRALPLRPSGQWQPERLGVPRRFLDGWLGAGTRAAFERLLSRLRERGVVLVDVDAPSMSDALAIYAPLRSAESAYVHRAALEREPEHFLPQTLDRLRDGQKVGAQAYFECQRRRAHMRVEIAAALAGVDALVLPTAPLPAPVRGCATMDLERGPTEHRAAFLRLTLPFSFTGFPALSVPFDRAEGLPLGVQIVGREHDDARVLEIGACIEALLAD